MAKRVFQTMRMTSALIAAYLLIDYSISAFAVPSPETIVFGVKTEISMGDKEPIRKDFYVSIGLNQGVKVGSVLDVYRTVTTTDDINNKSSQNIIFKIAKLKVIHSESDVAVARIQELLSPNEVPIGIFPTVIVGDRVSITAK